MNIGDQVRLGDQGPILTVTHVSDDGPGKKHATVAWYDPKRGFIYETLPVAALKPVERRKVEGNFVDSKLAAELQEKMRREAERAFGAGFMKPIPVLLPTEQRIRGLEMELADANDQLKAYKFQLEHLDKLRAAAVAADVVFHQRDSGEWEATTPVTLHKSLDELMRIEKLNALLAAHDQDVIKLRAKLADTEEQLLVMKACAEGAQHELARVYDQARRIGDERTELKVKLASERSRNTELSGQVNVAGALGVRWTWEGGVCKAHIDDSGLRDQLKTLADFHNKVARLVNG